MAKFKYLGDSGVLVGRHGRLKHGQIVELWQSEVEYITERGCVGWEPIEEEPDMEGVGVVIPVATRYYNLTRIHWTRNAISALRNMGNNELIEIGNAMRELGAKLPNHRGLVSLGKDRLAEVIYGEAARLQWTAKVFAPVDRNAKPESDLPILPPPNKEGGLEGEVESPPDPGEDYPDDGTKRSIEADESGLPPDGDDRAQPNKPTKAANASKPNPPTRKIVRNR